MISIGDKLDGKYVVNQLLGSGGFGKVFLADDAVLANRQVAIKVLARSESGDQSNLVWEMDKLSQFSHPHVVAFYHHFEHAESQCLVMEYCPGGSLDDRIQSEGNFSVEQCRRRCKAA